MNIDLRNITMKGSSQSYFLEEAGYSVMALGNDTNSMGKEMVRLC
jgi:hypothetical protein